MYIYEKSCLCGSSALGRYLLDFSRSKLPSQANIIDIIYLHNFPRINLSPRQHGNQFMMTFSASKQNQENGLKYNQYKQTLNFNISYFNNILK
jgi:hypothetical protein